MNGREMTAADENPAHSGTYTIERPKNKPVFEEWYAERKDHQKS